MMIPFAGPRVPLIRDPDGGKWSSAWPDHSVITHIPAGACTPGVTIPLRGPRVPIPAAVRDSAVATVTEAASQYGPPGPDLEKIPRTFPAFDVMRLDQGGQLWVSRQSGATQKQFQVYRPDGVLLATLDLPVTLEPLRPMIITESRIYGFVTDADGVPYLVAYRIAR